MSSIPWLDESSDEFPSTSQAFCEPNGLLAAGGSLSPDYLLKAYSRGIFPWYSDGQPILWWSPSPRLVLKPADLHVGKTLKKLIRKKPFRITVDAAFEEVIKCCAEVPRGDQDGTWITYDMESAYRRLHQMGYAHSVEAWRGNELVGGLYGISIGKVFFGESMFSKESGASKLAFVTLAQTLNAWNFELIDCQIYTEYLASFGAKEIERDAFESLLAQSIQSVEPSNWAERWPHSENCVG